MSSAKTPPGSIEECLFGPSKVCPQTVEGSNISPKTPPRNKASSSCLEKTPPRRPSKMSPGVDGLDQGRWASATTPTAVSIIEACGQPSHTINLQQLRRIVSQGVGDKGSHRAVAWRVLLGYLPPDTSTWKDSLEKERSLYKNLVSEIFVLQDTDGRDLQGHHSKRVNEAAKQQQQKREEALQKMAEAPVISKDEDPSSRSKSLDTFLDNHHDPRFPKRSHIRRRASLAYPPTFEISPPLPRRKSLSDLQELKEAEQPHHQELLSEHSTRTRELFIANERVENRSERTRSFLRTIGLVNAKILLEENSSSDTMLQVIEEKESETSHGSGSTTPLSRSSSGGIANTVANQYLPLQNGYSELVIPAKIKEQWKRSGRDASALAGMSGGIPSMNTLLVVDDQGYSPSRKERVTVNDDPLTSLDKHDDDDDDDEQWSQFYENAMLLDEIRKDVVRTHPDLFFFLEPKHNLGQRRYAAIERILFVWAKLNKGVRYVQGMNEIVGTLYYVLANDFNEDWACNAEADAYFLFNTLMVEMRDVFVPDLDEADTGIHGRIAHLQALLSMHDPEVSAHLHDCGIDASFYAIRWLTTLLSREFLLPDTIRLWDSMFASTHKDNFLRYVCVSMVMIVRKDLLKGDFSTCLRLLQSYPNTNVDVLLEASRALWIYESQVTLACHKGGISLQKALCNIAPPPAIIMAYGLPGGVTFKHDERPKPTPEKSKTPARHKTPKKNAGDAVGGFMSQARGYFGRMQKRYKDSKAR